MKQLSLLIFLFFSVVSECVADEIRAELDNLKEAEFSIRLKAKDTLVQKGISVVPRLIAASSDQSPLVRMNVISALGLIGEEPKEVLPILARALDDPEIGVRSNAAQALGGFGVVAKSYSQNLVDSLRDPSPHVRSSAAASLGLLGDSSAVTISSLTHAAFTEVDPLAFNFAVHSLILLDRGAVVSSSPKTLSLLARNLKSNEPGIAISAVWAFADLGSFDETVRDNLMRIVESGGDFPLRVAAAVALSNAGLIDRNGVVLSVLKEATQRGETVLKERASAALKKTTGSPETNKPEG